MKEENKNRKGHEYGKHNFPSDINIHSARQLECNNAVIGLNREKNEGGWERMFLNELD